MVAPVLTVLLSVFYYISKNKKTNTLTKEHLFDIMFLRFFLKVLSIWRWRFAFCGGLIAPFQCNDFSLHNPTWGIWRKGVFVYVHINWPYINTLLLRYILWSWLRAWTARFQGKKIVTAQAWETKRGYYNLIVNQVKPSSVAPFVIIIISSI